MAIGGIGGFYGDINRGPVGSDLSKANFGKKPIKPGTYPGAILQGAQDYDEIMQRYRNISSGGDENLNKIMQLYKQQQSQGNYNPQDVTYNRSKELGEAFGSLSDLAKTGGLSEADKYSLRERGTSPIRSIYANAQRNMQRGRALQGGYSPNLNAASAKMAREMSGQIGDQMNNVNASIAQMVQQGKLSAAPQYASAAQRELDLMGQIGLSNQSNKLRANELGQQNLGMLQSFYQNQNQNRMQATEGMRALYGTTPANAQLYGNQALQQQQIPRERRMNRGAVTWMGNR